MQQIVYEETAAQPNPDPEGESDHSQPITFEAEVHQDENEEVSDSSETQIVNVFPSPMHSAECVSNKNYEHVCTRPLADTSGASSQLLVTYSHVSMRPDSCRNDGNLSPTMMMRDHSSVAESSSILPLQNTDNSQAYPVVSDTSCPSFHPDNLRHRYHQYCDRTNTIGHEQLMAQVTGGDLSVEMSEPNNDRHLMDSANAHVVRQISAAANSENLTGDPNVLRQISSDSG